ncbi:hypothetical protein Dip518_000228 [Parelusimicrobium proximum]|uniref:hypothetical protein n=1 Tax=Parelusimicrobium proximum TaxID=3228953 RepID=UPI003D187176
MKKILGAVLFAAVAVSAFAQTGKVAIDSISTDTIKNKIQEGEAVSTFRFFEYYDNILKNRFSVAYEVLSDLGVKDADSLILSKSYMYRNVDTEKLSSSPEHIMAGVVAEGKKDSAANTGKNRSARGGFNNKTVVKNSYIYGRLTYLEGSVIYDRAQIMYLLLADLGKAPADAEYILFNLGKNYLKKGLLSEDDPLTNARVIYKNAVADLTAEVK